MNAADGVAIEKYGFFFVPRQSLATSPPHLRPAADRPCAVGRVVVQKQLVDTNGQPIFAELGSIQFQILSAGLAIGDPFSTDSSGRAISPPVPRNTPLTVHEVAAPAGFQQAADAEITLTEASQLVAIVNQQIPSGPTPVYSR